MRGTFQAVGVVGGVVWVGANGSAEGGERGSEAMTGLLPCWVYLGGGTGANTTL